MIRYLRFSAYLFLSVILSACTTALVQEGGDSITEQAEGTQPEMYKYAAWRLDNSGANEAIKGLLTEADQLIADDNINAAEDKLERLLRVKPDYAPAWSRLSWLALATNAPERAVQMAKRSNSFAQTDAELQRLNWSFIRAASQQLHDNETYFQADREIESLKPF